MDERKLKIKQLIINRLNLKISTDEFKNDAKLFVPKENGGVGLDSVDTLEIAVGLMNEFDVEISDEDMYIFESINTIDAFLEQNT